MAYANRNTMTLDTLFVRDIIFKDVSNRPISAGQTLLTRGDGGTFWGNAPGTSSFQGAFNIFQGGSTFTYIASNYTNTLWFEPGSGIQFYSTIDGNQPKMWIAATGPEQLQIAGGSTLVFADLHDDLSGGRTLVFAGSPTLPITISDNVVFFNTNIDSQLSSIIELQSTTIALQSTTEQLQSTTENLQETTSTLINEVSSLLTTVDLLLLSSAVSTFWSTLTFALECCADNSTFIHSTFNISNDFLNITYPQVFISSLTVNEITGVDLSSIGQIISTYSTLYWSTGTGINTLTSSLRVSTIEGVTSPIINFDQANNRIGINLGNTPPRTTVDVGGTVFASNFVTTSDRRMKTNLEPLSFKTPLPSYRFEWRGSGEKDIGVMADDVEAVAPECVYTDDGGYKAVNYSKLVPVCFSILNDMCARMSTLESRALQCKCH